MKTFTDIFEFLLKFKKPSPPDLYDYDDPVFFEQYAFKLKERDEVIEKTKTCLKHPIKTLLRYTKHK